MLKERLRFFQSWFGKKISFIDVNPNYITLSSIVFAVLASYFIFKRELIAIGLIILAFFLDFLDGAIAREKNKTSVFGAYLDGISDRFVEFFIISPFLFFEESKIAAIILLFFGTFMHSFSKAYSSHRNVIDNQKASTLKSFFGRTERGILMIFFIFLFLINNDIYVYFLWASAILSLIAFLLLQVQILKYSKKK